MLDLLKGNLKSKTVWFANALVIAGLLEQHGHVLTQLIPDEYQGLAVSLVGLAVWGLRAITTKPLTEK